VVGTESLVSKFLNKEHIYGDLLGKIASNEKEIEDLNLVHE
jgi:YesN/AraC family two-component response regulator